jgi:hypothetical protein
MAIYADLLDCTDPVVPVEESDLDAADRTVLTLLRNKGVDPTLVTDAGGLALLRDFAVAEASAYAARRTAVEGVSDSAMWAKHAAYTKHAMQLAQTINRESLGVAEVGSGAAGYGSIPVWRA